MLRMIVVKLGNAFRNKYKKALTKSKTESSLNTKGTFLSDKYGNSAALFDLGSSAQYWSGDKMQPLVRMRDIMYNKSAGRGTALNANHQS